MVRSGIIPVVPGSPLNIVLAGSGGLTPGDDFFAASGATVPFSNAHDASAAYFTDTNTTWFAWEASSPAGAGGFRHPRIKTYNHTTGIWSPEYVAGLFGLTDDNHGQPVICRDDNGYVHMFYGSHATFIRCASTHNPNDPSIWRENATITGSWSYYHPYVIGGVIYLFTRDATTSTQRDFQLIKTTAITAGVPTWGSAASIIDLDADSRVYKGVGFVDGLNIHFVACRSDANDTARKNVYYYVYETDTGDVRNFDDNVTIDVLDLPVDLTESTNSFQLALSAGSNVTNIPAACLDTNGHPHVLYSDGLAGAATLKHVWHNGTAWQAAANVGGTMTDVIDSMGIHPMAGGGVAALWPEDESSLWDRGGNMRRNTWTPAGGWGTAATIRKAEDWPFNGGMKVRDGIAGARAFFSEQQINETDEVGALKVYAVKEDGSFLFVPPLVHTPVNAETTTLCDRFTTPPTIERLAVYDAFISKIKDIGIAKFLGMYLLDAADDQCIRQNLIADAFNLTPNGGLTFTADRGVTGNGTTGFYGTGFVPSVNGGSVFTQNSAHLSAYTHVVDDNDAVIMAAWGTPGSYIQPRTSANQVQVRMNTGTGTLAANSNASGLFVANRAASNDTDVDRNAAQILTTTQASTGLPTVELLLFTNGTLFSNNRASFFSFGASLGATAATDRLKLFHAQRFWKLSVGNMV